MVEPKQRVAVVGASGYTGAELVRLCLGHPAIELTAFAGHGSAGKSVADVLPSVAGVVDATIIEADAAAIADRADVAFCGLPHAASAPLVDALRDRGLTVFDLSADFRIPELEVYERWYGPHKAPARLKEAVYGLVELNREALRAADLIAVPGCYPTAAVLALAPLVRAGWIDLGTLIVDAKSGASGAGRGLSENTHFAQLAEGLRAYKVAGLHRHTGEIEMVLSRLSGSPVTVTFTPHLVPMIRGILATSYAKLREPVSAEQMTERAQALYEGSPSVSVLEPGKNPDTAVLRGSNRAHVSYVVDERNGRVIAQCAIDNLVKGASGQALQCFNVRYGLAESTGLSSLGLFP